ncbi:ribosomal RNA small subunit methyltransferase A [Candidatus Berkelbacteria bacterium]|nr:ribosomal RNA small subunit methyltransferase A [Candidatus Berkelbacteria bacterium]
MGQHFLVSGDVLLKIIAAADLKPTDAVLEIGPGTGTLTRALAERAGQVIAVEKDERLFNALDEELEKEGIANVRLIHGDILKLLTFNFKLETPYKVVANIPYYLTSRLIRRLLEANPPPQEILLMIQKEVAERIVAAPPRMNLLAIAVQAYGRPEIVAHIPASAFAPRPKVDSALIRIANISAGFFDAAGVRPERFFLLVKGAFSQRRKTLANSLAPALGGKAAVREALKTIGRAETARPQELSIGDWARLCRIAP